MSRRVRGRPLYGQVVVGPPGSGKTTYCNGMQQYLPLVGRPHAVVINLDPANEGLKRSTTIPEEEEPVNKTKSSQKEQTWLPYTALFDVCEEVVELSSVMEKMGLGPNGGLVYCMEYMQEHADAMIALIQERLLESTNNTTSQQEPYVILDLPGQVELYTHSTVVQTLLEKLTKALDLRLTAVQLIDAHYCTDATKFLSAALLGTTTMIRLELPIVNVLSKVDLLANYGELSMDLDYFTACQDLDRLLPFLDAQSEGDANVGGADEHDDWVEDADFQKARQKRMQSKLARKHAKLHQAMAEVVDDYGLVSFIPLDISNAESVGRVLAKVDKANGFVFTTNNTDDPTSSSIPNDMFQVAVQSDRVSYDATAMVREHLAKEKIEELNR